MSSKQQKVLDELLEIAEAHGWAVTIEKLGAAPLSLEHVQKYPTVTARLAFSRRKQLMVVYLGPRGGVEGRYMASYADARGCDETFNTLAFVTAKLGERP